MSVLARFSPASLTPQKYDEAVSRVNEELGEELSGCEIHTAFIGPDGNIRVSEIWDPREKLEAFIKRLRPVLAEVGVDPGEPEVLDVHNIQKR